MKADLQRAIQGLLRVGNEQRRVDDHDLVPFEEEDDQTFGCEVRDSRGLRWVLAPDAEAAERWLATREDAVFTRAEIKDVSYGIQAMTPDERQEWLADMVALKAAVPTAQVRSITFRNSVIQRRRK